jgi:hypothetical protein
MDHGFGFRGNQLITMPSKTIYLDNYADASFPASEFTGYTGIWQSLDSDLNVNLNGSRFVLATPTPTPTTPPTPVPTPSGGNIIISSNPSDATVYIDNVIKGITPLKINIENGEHVVRIRLYGYQEYTTTVVVNGEDVSINPVLIPLTTVATTVATTVPKTVVTTIPTTEPTMEPTTEPTTEPMVEPMSLEQPVSDEDALANMQSQIDAQATKNAEQDVIIVEQSEQIDVLTQIINFILSFLGVK